MIDSKISGEGLLLKGLTRDGESVDGLGVVTQGFLWPCYSPFIQPIGVTSTTWSQAAGVSTIWSQSAGVTISPWAGATSLVFGDC